MLLMSVQGQFSINSTVVQSELLFPLTPPSVLYATRLADSGTPIFISPSTSGVGQGELNRIREAFISCIYNYMFALG